ncbi:MAG: sensor histidine kinase, partial [Bacteroidota bacterium]|nr:sensor histidine kinase [Bacteroidota bacterium]
GEVAYINRQGEKKYLLKTLSLVLNENGDQMGLLTVGTDITDRKFAEKKLLGEEINKQKIITQASINGQEKERKEIGSELHDNIGQQLAATKLYLDLAKSTADVITAPMVWQAVKLVSKAINDVRTMAHSLVPPNFGDLGLVESLKELYEPIMQTRAVRIRFYHDSFDEQSLPENLKLALFRIIQEQLNNTLKYAEAKNVVISLEMEGRQVLLEVSDDGKGFDIKKTKKGIGLNNITNRAELLYGNAAIDSAPGKGCTLSVSIPA